MSDKLYTWIDVQNRLRAFHESSEDGKGREWFIGKSARAYWDGLRISLVSGEEEANKTAIRTQLGEIFLARYDQERDVITLGEMPNEIDFPIFFEEEESETDVLKEYFRAEFSPLSYVATVEPFKKERTRKDDEPVILAFHSFKGGVGRTLHAIALTVDLSREGQKVLLIDADFEAPGISWYLSNPEISFADFIAMAHGDSSPDFNYSLQNAASQIPLNNNDENIYILPAFRDAGQFGEPVIKPEHLNTVDRPFLLQDLVIELGKKLRVDYIIVDLRAGLSELSSGWLLDPKILKAEVTTISGQSLRGTQSLIERTREIHEKFTLSTDSLPPFLVFSQISEEIDKTIRADWAGEDNFFFSPDYLALKKCYISFFETTSGDNDPVPGWARTASFSIEYPSLKNLPHDWSEVVEKIFDSKIAERLDLLKQWLPLPPQGLLQLTELLPSKNGQVAFTLDERRKKLSATAEGLITADAAIADDFLVTQPIEQLAIRHTSMLPIAIVVGAKGAGKTYLFKSMGRFSDWGDFVRKVKPSLNGEVISSRFCKITTPESVIAEEKGAYREIIKEFIQEELKSKETTSSQWRKKWLDIIAWANGFKVAEEGVWDAFLAKNSDRVICLFDGLEELFAKYFEDEAHKTALRALIQDVPNWLESLPQRNVGIVIFIRQDIVSYVILQNVAQFLSKNKDFQLKWNEEEGLRLAYWVSAIKANAIPQGTNPIRNMSRPELETLLIPLWGRKLGGNDSREAGSATWILDALSNFQDEVQSRDIVRLLFVAADISKDADNRDSYPDRLLTPKSIKNSISTVGSAKIGEVKDENFPLYEILQKIKDKAPELKFPCTKSNLSFLNPEEQDMLDKNGILKERNNEFYLAEIYRRGLSVSYSKRGKPRLL